MMGRFYKYCPRKRVYSLFSPGNHDEASNSKQWFFLPASHDTNAIRIRSGNQFTASIVADGMKLVGLREGVRRQH